ncbi:MAG: alpha/beta hydrolase fold protein [Hyphomicrobiales bacterium]|nr:alpha/beta hydrolase fold protein [Hyphomicrobiales bacterium]
MPSSNLVTASRAVNAAGVRLEITEGGAGRPIVFLHPGVGLRDASPFLERIRLLGHVIAPAHPGFHGSENSPSVGSVDDLAYLYLDFLESLDEPAIIVGVSLGGWIALEMAVKSTHHIAGLVLADSVGVRFETRGIQDFADIHALSRTEINERVYHNSTRGEIDYPSRPPAELELIARNREAELRYTWSPYMHSPKLGTRLHRVDVPTLVVWGESDGLVPPAYGQRLAKALPQATFETIAEAGHFPHVEQPDQLAARIERFIGSLPRGAAGTRQKELVR